MRRLLTPLLIATVVACNSEGPAAPDRPVTAVAVAPATSTMLVGQSVQLVAAITGGYTKQVITWTVANAAVATVDDTGRVVAKSVGSTVVTATAGGISATANIIVTTGVTSITVTPASPALIVGQALQLSATTSGIASNPTITWASSNGGVATVSSTGQVTAVGTGTASVSASAGGMTSAVTVTVTSGAVDRVSVCDRAATGCTADATLSAIGTAVAVRATAYNVLGADISAGCAFVWTPSAKDIVSIAYFGDNTKRDALITRTGLGILSIVVTCNGIPGVFTVIGPTPITP